MSKVLTRIATLLVALVAIAAVSPAAVSAQQPQPIEPIENLEDEELEQFAKVYLEVQWISQEAEAELATVQDPEQAQAIQQEAQQQVTEVLEEHELEIERYRRIGMTLNQDQELAERFVAILEELQEGEGGVH